MRTKKDNRNVQTSRRQRPQQAVTNETKPLTEAERAEYKRLLKQWTRNRGAGAETLTQEQVARFSELSDRISAEGA